MTTSPFENLPYDSPLQPVKLELDDKIQFRCHKDINCFNECCKKIDISLTPYDILCLQKHLNLNSSEFLSEYTVPFEMDKDGLPGVKIKTTAENPACPFLQKDGCSVYDVRPTVCRYYALGLMSLRKEKSSTDENAYFLVKEEHCLGHNEDRTISVSDYRNEQGVDKYDEINREWRQIILKKRSAGPTVGKPSERSLKFFFLCSYNFDSFRTFTQSENFAEVYDLTPEETEKLNTDDIALLKFGSRLLKQVLFGEMTIAIKDNAMQNRVHRRREQIQADPDDPNANYDGPEMV